MYTQKILAPCAALGNENGCAAFISLATLGSNKLMN